VELIGTNDTSFIGGDAYVRATLIAQTATNAQVGIHPTNPLTREPQIMAAFLGSIDAMTEGRAFLDIGSGDSAVYNIGRRGARSRLRRHDAECHRQGCRPPGAGFRCLLAVLGPDLRRSERSVVSRERRSTAGIITMSPGAKAAISFL
jgi:hypothetical protein